MAYESAKRSIEKDQSEIAASAACTRSGAFALLLTIVLFLLAAYWTERRKDVALGQYVTYRLNLKLSVDRLDEDPVWQRYKASNRITDSISLAELLKHSSIEPPNAQGSDKQVQPTSGASPKSPESQAEARQFSPQPPGELDAHSWKAKPNSPRLLSVKVFLAMPEIDQIGDLLTKLNDPTLLSTGRQVSNFSDYTIVRWVIKRADLLYKNSVNTSCTKNALEVPHARDESPYFVPELNKDALLDCLTLSDLRELVDFELPTLNSVSPFGERIVKGVQLSPGSLPNDPFQASVVTQILLAFVVVYFGAFAREAVSSEAFPSPGTLFGAFSRSRSTLTALLIALMSPVIASIAVGVTARRWALGLCSVPIVAAIFSVYRALQGKSYFGSILPWAARRQRGRV